METIAYVEIDLLALAYLVLIFINMHHQTEKYLFEDKLFIALLGANALLLALDAVTWALDGKPGLVARDANLLFIVAYFIMNPVPCMLWSFYANYHVYRNEKTTRKLFIPLAIPVFANMVISVLSILTGDMFFFDDNNVYHRGKLFVLMTVLCLGYLAFTMIFLIIKRKYIEKKYLIPILVFALPPIIGGILQAMFYGLALLWPCMAISVQIIFMNIQNEQLYKDHLTGLYNRRQLDFYLQQRIKNGSKGNLLAGIMIDINSFKNINDIWGHAAGDQALADTGKILSMSFEKNDMVCRYGGDEFVIMIEIKEESELTDIVNRIKTNVAQYNIKKITPYAISLSMGYAVYNDQTQTTMDQFLTHIDSLMYEDKKKQKF